MKSYLDPKMKYADVLLISPVNRLTTVYAPAGLLSIATHLDRQGIPTAIVDIKPDRLSVTEKIRNIMGNRVGSQFDIEEFYKHVFEAILHYRPKLIGIPSYTTEYLSVMEMAKRIREWGFQGYMVAGGVHVTLRPKEVIYKESPFDYGISGDGETPLHLLYRSLMNKDDAYKTIQGVSYYDSEKDQVVCNGLFAEPDLTTQPIPDYSKIDMEFYLQPHTHNVRWSLVSGVAIFTSRGCPYSCTFCAVDYMRRVNKSAAKIRYRKLEDVFEELERLKRDYKIDSFYAQDDCFMVSKARTIEFCEGLIARKLNMIWGAETRVNLVTDRSLLELMKKAGCVQLDFGVESGSPARLAAIEKAVTVEKIQAAFDLCREVGIRTFANMMYNLPDETEEDVKANEVLLDKIKPTAIGAATTVPMLGTEMYEVNFVEKLERHEYNIYNSGVYEMVIDRFKMSKHNLDVGKIVRDINEREIRSGAFHKLFIWKPFYWKMILFSPRKWQYVRVATMMFFAWAKRRISRWIKPDSDAGSGESGHDNKFDKKFNPTPFHRTEEAVSGR